ncbi:MAG: hypothetical protein ACXVZR_03800 [Terriglobales bacterium]
MTMIYNFLKGQYEDDGSYDVATVDYSGSYSGQPGYVLPDVSQGGPDMSPSTPTGNGTGYYANAPTQSSWGDLAKQAVQYVLNKDAAKNAQATQLDQRVYYAALQSQQAQVKARQNLFVLLLIVGGVALLAHEK